MADVKSPAEFAHPGYWNTRYSTPGKTSFEWFQACDHYELLLFLNHLQVSKESRILHLGCGNSTLPIDLCTLSYRNHVCVDFSKVVIEQMASRYETEKGIEWRVMDVRDMNGFPNDEFEVALDKSTMDSMIQGSLFTPSKEVRKNIGAYLAEVARVLKPGGIFIYITYQPAHLIKPLLLYKNNKKPWHLTVENAGPAEAGTIPYLAYIMRKKPVLGDEERSLDSDDQNDRTSNSQASTHLVHLQGGSDDGEMEGTNADDCTTHETSTLEWLQGLDDVEHY